jgi:hypothetical protein
MWGSRRAQPIAPAAVIASVPTISAPTVFAAAVLELEPNRTKPVEPLEPLDPWNLQESIMIAACRRSRRSLR